MHHCIIALSHLTSSLKMLIIYFLFFDTSVFLKIMLETETKAKHQYLLSIRASLF